MGPGRFETPALGDEDVDLVEIGEPIHVAGRIAEVVLFSREDRAERLECLGVADQGYARLGTDGKRLGRAGACVVVGSDLQSQEVLARREGPLAERDARAPVVAGGDVTGFRVASVHEERSAEGGLGPRVDLGVDLDRLAFARGVFADEARLEAALALGGLGRENVDLSRAGGQAVEACRQGGPVDVEAGDDGHVASVRDHFERRGKRAGLGGGVALAGGRGGLEARAKRVGRERKSVAIVKADERSGLVAALAHERQERVAVARALGPVHVARQVDHPRELSGRLIGFGLKRTRQRQEGERDGRGHEDHVQRATPREPPAEEYDDARDHGGEHGEMRVFKLHSGVGYRV